MVRCATGALIVLLTTACSSGDGDPTPVDEPDAAVAGDDAGMDASADAAVSPPDPLVVSTTGGLVRGRRDHETTAWKGIPFAAPPVGELRWRAPEPPERWEGVRPAAEFGPKCMQVVGPDEVAGDEDCLTLNVWAPLERDPGVPLPVMFFIHGGDNIWGSTSDEGFSQDVAYDGSYLAERSHAVVVTVEYRLAAFGFLAHPAFAEENDEGSAGNYAILDQIAALRWTQDNIAGFGGDPDRVMLFGHSAGSVDTCTLVVSPLAAGLFQAALLQSGPCVVVPREQLAAAADAVETAFGCDGAADVAACLRSRPAEEIADAPGASLWRNDGLDYDPVADGWVLPGDPEALLRAGQHNHVPLVFGTTTDEYSSIIDLMSDTPLDTEEQYREWVYGLGEWAGDFISEHYPPEDYESPRAAIVAFVGDWMMHCPVRRLARAAAHGQDEPVYRYLYGFRFDREPYRSYGAAHGFEVGLLWERALPVNDRERAISDTITSIWSSFAATGDPTGGAIAWPVYDEETDPALWLDEPLSTVEGVRTDACDVLDPVL